MLKESVTFNEPTLQLERAWCVHLDHILKDRFARVPDNWESLESTLIKMMRLNNKQLWHLISENATLTWNLTKKTLIETDGHCVVRYSLRSPHLS